MQMFAEQPKAEMKPWEKGLGRSNIYQFDEHAWLSGLLLFRGSCTRSLIHELAGSGLITGIRQRVMAYLYLRGLQQKGDENQRSLMMYFEDFAGLVMWKVKLLALLGPQTC